MPKKNDKHWLVDIRPEGRNGRRVRRQFGTKAEALRFETWIQNKADKGEWEPSKPDKRRLSELVALWYELHGQQLKKGERRLHEFTRIIELLQDPIANQLTTNQFAKFRALRLKTVKRETANRDLTNLCSVYNELRRLKEISYPNPLADIKKLTIEEPELTYLRLEQINNLLFALDKAEKSHARVIARICLSTGARWGEAATTRPQQIVNGKITFSGTKSGKNRSVPISEDLQKLVLEHAPLADGMNTFKRVVKQIGLKLPKGQMTHVLRHSFASHFMINGGNIITLQRILGHGSIMMTMRYAHLSPDHLNEALKLNPLSKMST